MDSMNCRCTIFDRKPTPEEQKLKANIEAIENEAAVKIAEAKANAEREKFVTDLQLKAANVRVLYDAYIAQGFTEEQAWELIKPYAAYQPINFCV